MTTHKYLPSFVCGFSAAVISTIPGIRSIACCFVVPAAAWFSLVLDHKINKAEPPVSVQNALFFGLLTGLFAAIFSTGLDILMTFIMHSNDFVRSLPQTEIIARQWNLGDIWNQTQSLLRKMSTDIKVNGFSLTYSAAILFSNLIIDIVFGIIGGLLGMLIQNRKTIQ